jgi:uncharacterized RDD family membrane protein YckC
MTGVAAASEGEGEEARPAAAEPEPRYSGLATRGIAFVIDAALIDLVALIVAGGAALIASIFHFPHELQTILKVIGAVLAVLWAVGYFVGFWSATGQTPGDRVMQVRVVTADGERVKPGRGVLRFIGLILAALPLFAGYLLILFDRRRRGLQDRLAGTVVIEAPDLSLAEAQLARARQAPDGARTRQAPGPARPPQVPEPPRARQAPEGAPTRSTSVVG